MLIGPAIEELLRFDSPVQWASRVAREEIELGGKRIAPGDFVLASLGAANRDPNRFDRPDSLDIRRPDNKHLAFGQGIHFCLGAALARMEGQIAIEAILARLKNLRLLGKSRLKWNKSVVFRGVLSLPVAFDV